MAQHNETGRIGESIAARHLEQNGYKITDRNYNKKCGEIDIVAKKKGVMHFIEVKSTAMSFRDRGVYTLRPEEKVDGRKLKRLSRAVQIYASERAMSLERERWQCDVCVVYLDHEVKQSAIEYIRNILLPE
ncbi:MAG: YraN family protein [Candidatus Paceibacterota bacterium]